MDDQSIFLAALEKATPAERSAFVAEACQHDAALKADVEELLRANAELAGKDFLNTSARLFEPEFNAGFLLKPGSAIGPYKLRELLGEGGMGAVYVAEQTAPVRRKVALKIVRPGMATQEVVARFEAERQALAMMDHPSIAKVHDGGETEAGQPYFVMELVQGLPITEYCDEERLSTEERLKLFTQVCRAVQHAHQKGVIHRDLKPSNILVSEIDGKPVPKVIDFGVAKAIGQGLTEETLYTHFSQMVGTPLYMSPEQTGLGVVDVDTRSDVYSLGVLLYELLTGTTPFDSATLKAAGFDEMRRIIREDEPARPSAQVSTLAAEALSTIAERRKSDPRKFSSTLVGELDWLVMKALEKDRARRYQSAGELAEDVERYLASEAVEACPPSVIYRVAKFAKRNRAGLVTVGLVLTTLLLGLAGTSWQAWRATTALSEAENNLALAQHNLELAESNLQIAKTTVDEWYLGFADEWLEGLPGLTDKQRDLVSKAAQFYEQFASQDADTEFALGRAETLNRLAVLQQKLGDGDAARRSIDQAIEAAAPLANASHPNPQARLLLAKCYRTSAQLYRAIWDADHESDALRRAMELLREMQQHRTGDLDAQLLCVQVFRETGLNAWRLGQLEVADRLVQQASEEVDRLLSESPDNVELQAEQVLCLNAVVATRFKRESTILVTHELREGFLLEETAQRYRRVLQAASDRLAREPHSVGARMDFRYVAQLADALLPEDEAEQTLLRSRDLVCGLRDEFPESRRVYSDYVRLCYHHLERFYSEHGRDLEALDAARQMATASEQAGEPQNKAEYMTRAADYESIGDVLQRLHRDAEAATAFRISAQMASKALAKATASGEATFLPQYERTSARLHTKLDAVGSGQPEASDKTHETELDSSD